MTAWIFGLTSILLHAETPNDAGGRPWKGQYKIKPSEKDLLTVADVIGPDGIVYPN